MSNQVIEIDKYQPNHKRKCENCEATPTVEGVKDNKVVYRGSMCGPCTWGEASAQDPATRNS